MGAGDGEDFSIAVAWSCWSELSTKLLLFRCSMESKLLVLLLLEKWRIEGATSTSGTRHSRRSTLLVGANFWWLLSPAGASFASGLAWLFYWSCKEREKNKRKVEKGTRGRGR
uniref:Uncharacterized protein n=1 Tax=Solanum lycopersicum TaxID=4081 RepID=A0A3Q7EYF1_SOLLC